MSRRRESQSAEDLLRRLAQDPEWAEARRREDEERSEMLRRFDDEIAPVLDDLHRAGLSMSGDDVQSIAEQASPQELEVAAPILIAHLGRPYSDHVASVLAAGLRGPRNAPFWSEIAGLYAVESRPLTRELLAAALAANVPDEALDKLIDLVLDPSNGDSRAYLLLAFDRRHSRFKGIREAKFESVMERLRKDPALAAAVEGLKWHKREAAKRQPHQVDALDLGALTQTSVALDPATLAMFLRGLVSLGIGFQSAYGSELRRAIKSLDPDEHAYFRFELPGGPFGIAVHMDDVDSPDVSIYSDPQTIRRVADLLDAMIS